MGLIQKIKTVSSLASSRPKGWQSFIWNTTMARMQRVGPLLPPLYITIEPTNACNAKCPVCETGKGDMLRQKGMLDFDNFKRFIDQTAAGMNTLMFYFMGEPYLNRNFYDMVRYARQKNIYVDTCTNGDFVDAKGVIYSDINKISFQLGGMTEETHQRYRVGSSLKKARENLYELIEERAKHPESNVQIEVGLIVMRHNEHEIEAFLKWGKEIGVDVANVIDPCARNMLEAHAYLPKDKKYWFYDEEAFKQGSLRPKHIPDNECAWIWNSIVINWNGDAVPCCRDPNGLHVFGNVFEDGLMRVFNGKKAREFRRQILTDQRNVDICNLCSSYGVPELTKEQPMAFEIKRHSFNSEELGSADF